MDPTATGQPGWVALLGRPDPWVAAVGVVSALVLFWALRGVFPGSADVASACDPGGSPSPRLRDRLAAAAAAGLVLVGIGAWIAVTYGIPLSLPAFLIGYASLLAAARGARPHRHSSLALRRVDRFAETAVTATALAGVLVVANVAAFRYGSRPLDLTRERVHTLEPETARQIRALDRPARFTAFYYGRLPDAAKQVDRVRQLLGLFQAENPDRVAVDLVNFHGEPARAKELFARVPAAAVVTGGVVVELGEGDAASRLVVRNSEMFGAPTGSGPDSLAVDFRGEYALTTALARLGKGRRPKLYLTVGHGEPSSTELDVRQRGVGLLRARLTDVGFEVAELDLSGQEVPDDAAVVAVVGPRSPFPKGEVGRLGAHLDRGGRALLILDGRGPTGLEGLLRARRIELLPALVVEARGAAPDPTVHVRIPEGSEHPVLRPLAGQSVAFPAASPIRLLDEGQEAGPRPDTLLRTAPSAWGESRSDAGRSTFDPMQDVPGPMVVGVALADPAEPGGAADPSRPHLVLFSAGDLADNRFARFVGYETNLDLAVNAANWLRAEPDLPEIAPRTRTLPRLDPDPNVQVRLLLLPTLLALSLILGFAVAVLVSRHT